MSQPHLDDLCGKLLKGSDEWTHLKLAAIAEQDEQIQTGEGVYRSRRAGDPLHPEREPKSVLDAIKSQLGSENFAAQYQQTPFPPGGAMIKRDWVQRYDQLPIHTASSYVFQSWDTAVKAEAENSFSVCTTWLVCEGKYYLVDVLRGHFDYPTLNARAISHAQKQKPNKILIEDAALGQALVAELKSVNLPAIAIKPEGDKRTRMSVQSIKFESGQVFLPREAPWLAAFEAELFAFPRAPHDDQVDSVSQALAHEGGSYEFGDFAQSTLEDYRCDVLPLLIQVEFHLGSGARSFERWVNVLSGETTRNPCCVAQLERASDRFSELHLRSVRHGEFTHWSLGSRCSANYHNASQPSDFKSALTPSAF